MRPNQKDEREIALKEANRKTLGRYHINDNVVITYNHGGTEYGTIESFVFNCFNEVCLRVRLVEENTSVDCMPKYASYHPENKTFTIEKL